MKFYDSRAEEKEIPYLEAYQGSHDVLNTIFVEKLIPFAKGYMLLSSEYKASVWTGSTAAEELKKFIEELEELNGLSQMCLFMRANPDNPKYVQVAFDCNDEHKAKWRKFGKLAWEATEILTKKKANDRVKQANALRQSP